jgi:GcrA cell cycle regulator
MEWNDETIARLRAFWLEGLSTAEIGRRMSVSKNAVVGKAHRLNLLARPSPIRRQTSQATSRPPVLRRVSGPTLPPLSTAAPLASEPPRPPVPAAKTPAAPASAKAPAIRPVAVHSGRVVSCCWPIGEPGTPSFRFCDADAANGKPYCAEHAQLAYVKVRDRREEAA